MTDDGQLIDQALQGTADAFGQLVRKYQDRLLTTMVHVTGSHEEAEDVAQEAFVQAFVKLETFQRKSKFYTWLYRIAFNISISRRRRKKPVVSTDAHRELTGTEPQDKSLSVEQVAEQQEHVACVQSALHELTDEHRRIVILRDLDGRSYDEIAEILELAVGTVRSRLHRARKQLHDVLKKRHAQLF